MLDSHGYWSEWKGISVNTHIQRLYLMWRKNRNMTVTWFLMSVPGCPPSCKEEPLIKQLLVYTVGQSLRQFKVATELWIQQNCWSTKAYVGIATRCKKIILTQWDIAGMVGKTHSKSHHSHSLAQGKPTTSGFYFLLIQVLASQSFSISCSWSCCQLSYIDMWIKAYLPSMWDSYCKCEKNVGKTKKFSPILFSQPIANSAVFVFNPVIL